MQEESLSSRRTFRKACRHSVPTVAAYESWFTLRDLADSLVGERSYSDHKAEQRAPLQRLYYLGRPPLECERGGRRAPRAITSYQKGPRQDSEHRSAIVGNGNQFPRTPSCSVWSARGVTTDEHSGQLSCPQRSAQGSYSEIRRICTRLPMSGKRSSGLITVVLSIPPLWSTCSDLKQDEVKTKENISLQDDVCSFSVGKHFWKIFKRDACNWFI